MGRGLDRIGGRAATGLERAGIGIESEADLAPALGDERRQPVREGLCAQPPLTCFFRPEPAEKRGTLPPGMKIRSPVRGLTP